MYSAELELENRILREETKRLKSENQSLKYRLEDAVSDARFLVISLRDDINNKIDDLIEALEDINVD